MASPHSANAQPDTMNSRIRFTIATVTWNAAPVLQRTLDSVASQDYPDVEHLIIDGQSKDNTMQMVEAYKQANTSAHEIVAISEPDKGLYDAMNKALAMATGDYILFLNAGDKFHAADTLSLIAKTAQTNADGYLLPGVIYGHTDIVDDNGQFLRHRRLAPPEKLTWESFTDGMLVCHQAFFANMVVASELTYDTNYRFSADYDWCIRIMKEATRLHMPLSNAHIVVADYLDGGMTTQNHRKSLIERLKVMAHHYGWAKAIGKHIYFVFRAIKAK